MDDPDRTKRRHVRDKAVIEHLANKVFETPSIPDTKRQSPTTDTGLSAVSGKLRRIEPGKPGVVLHNLGDRAVGERFRLRSAALEHRPEHWPTVDLRRCQPGLHRLHRAQPVAAWDGDLLACSFLVGLAAPDDGT